MYRVTQVDDAIAERLGVDVSTFIETIEEAEDGTECWIPTLMVMPQFHEGEFLTEETKDVGEYYAAALNAWHASEHKD